MGCDNESACSSSSCEEQVVLLQSDGLGQVLETLSEDSELHGLTGDTREGADHVASDLDVGACIEDFEQRGCSWDLAERILENSSAITEASVGGGALALST